MKKFEDTGMVTNIERPVHHRFSRSAKNIAILSESVAEEPNRDDSWSFSEIRTVLSHITVQFAFTYTHTAI